MGDLVTAGCFMLYNFQEMTAYYTAHKLLSA